MDGRGAVAACAVTLGSASRIRYQHPMPHLSWNEVRDRAIRFAREHAGDRSESAQKQTFWNDFFHVFGLKRAALATVRLPSEIFACARFSMALPGQTPVANRPPFQEPRSLR